MSTIPRREPVELRAAQVSSVDFPERIIEFIAVPYGEEIVVPYFDGKTIREVVEPGAFKGVEGRNHVTINRDHDPRRVVGKVVEFRTDDPRGLITRAFISRTELGDETLSLAADGILKASVGMVVPRTGMRIRNGLRRIKKAMLDHIALLPNPAYSSAEVLAVRGGLPEPTAEDVKPKPTPNLDEILALLEK